MLSSFRIALAAFACVALWYPSTALAGPANDNFVNAEILSGSLPIHASGSNVGATSEPGEPKLEPQAAAGHSIWFSWEATSTEFVTIGTCGSEINTVLGVYTGNGMNVLTKIASNRSSFGPNCQYFGSEVTFKAVSGTTYKIAVDGAALSPNGEPSPLTEGTVALQISAQPPPVNDNFENALTLEGTRAYILAQNWGATLQSGELEPKDDPGGASVWFDWTAPRSGGVFLQACGGQQETLVSAYTGESVGDLTPVVPLEANDTCQLAFAALAGVTYRIAIDGKRDPVTETVSMGQEELSLLMVPVNDYFEEASVLDGGRDVLYVGNSTIGATRQPGEPDIDGNPGGASVWFAWTAPETGSVRLSACDADFRPLLAAYTGASLTSLAPVKSVGAPPAEPCRTVSQPREVAVIAFNVDAGTTYHIAVDGYDGTSGVFDLGVEVSPERIIFPTPPVAEPNRKTLEIKLKDEIVRRHRGTASFALESSDLESAFLCRLGSRPFRKCNPTVSYRHLQPGRHVFMGKAVDETRNEVSQPVIVHFRTDGPQRRHSASRTSRV